MSNNASSGKSGAGKGVKGSAATGRGTGPGNAGGWPSTTGQPSGGKRSNAPPAKSR